jgi:hypothetical protein
LLLSDSDISIIDASLDHTVAAYMKREEACSAANDKTIYRNCPFKILFSQNGKSCGDAADQWDGNCGWSRSARALAGVHKLQTPPLIWASSNLTFPFERF